MIGQILQTPCLEAIRCQSSSPRVGREVYVMLQGLSPAALLLIAGSVDVQAGLIGRRLGCQPEAQVEGLLWSCMRLEVFAVYLGGEPGFLEVQLTTELRYRAVPSMSVPAQRVS